MKLNYAQELELDHARDDDVYFCGGALFPEDSYMRTSVVVRRRLNCKSLIEVTYYGAKGNLTNICMFCESTSGAELYEGEQVQELKRKYTVAR